MKKIYQVSQNEIYKKNYILFEVAPWFDFTLLYGTTQKGCIWIAPPCVGVDPSAEQWKELSQVVKEKKLLPFFDMAYQVPQA